MKYNNCNCYPTEMKHILIIIILILTYCKDDDDNSYERLIEINTRYTNELINRMEDVITHINDQINPALNSIQQIKDINKQQHKLEMKLIKLNDELNNINTKVNEMKQMYNNNEHKYKQLIELKYELRKYNESEINKMNCDDKYYDDMFLYGNGLNGKYYANEYFKGDYVYMKVNEEINISHDDIVSIPGIDWDNYSVEWEGFLRIPVTCEQYVFVIESNGCVDLVINNETVIEHNKGNMINAFKQLKHKDNKYQSLSKEYSYKSNDILQIKIKFYYSIHTNIYNDNNNNSFIKLLWKNSEWNIKHINKNFLFSSHPYNLNT